METKIISWQEKLDKTATKYHIIACWVAIILDPLWAISDYFILPDFFIPFLVARLLVAGITFLGLICKKHLSISMVAFIPVMGISLQNAYMYNVMEVTAFQQHTFAYIALFIGAGMLVLWKKIYTIVVVVISILANIILFHLFSPLTVDEFLINGGLLTMTVGLFSILLIQTRYRLTKKEIIARLELEKSKMELEEKNEIIEEKNKDITDSISYARHIQSAILPNRGEMEKYLKNYYIFFSPKDIVSGDFYWFSKRGNKLFFAVCDCTGHGVPGAFVSMIGNNLLNQTINEYGIEDPGEILSNLNKGMIMVFTNEGEIEARDGMDMSLLVLDMDANAKEIRKVSYAGANNSMYLIRKGIGGSDLAKMDWVAGFENDLLEIKADKEAIGGFTDPNYVFNSRVIELEPGDLVYAFSDGFMDQFGGPKGKKFMKKNFKKLFLEYVDLDMNTQGKNMKERIKQWMGEGEQIDDILVIGIKV